MDMKFHSCISFLYTIIPFINNFFTQNSLKVKNAIFIKFDYVYFFLLQNIDSSMVFSLKRPSFKSKIGMLRF